MLETKKKRKGKKLTFWKNEPDTTDLSLDLQMAKSVQDEHLSKVYNWRDLFDVKNDNSRREEGRSGLTVKLIKRYALWRGAILQNPLTKERDLFKILPSSPITINAAAQNQALLNYQFNTKMNKRKFIDDLIQSLIIDGTAIVRVSWELEESYRTVERPVYKYRKPSDYEKIQISNAIQQLDISGLYQDAILQNRGLKAIGKPISQEMEALLDLSTFGDDPSQSLEQLMEMSANPEIAGMDTESMPPMPLEGEQTLDQEIPPELSGINDMGGEVGPNMASGQDPLMALSGQPVPNQENEGVAPTDVDSALEQDPLVDPRKANKAPPDDVVSEDDKQILQALGINTDEYERQDTDALGMPIDENSKLNEDGTLKLNDGRDPLDKKILYHSAMESKRQGKYVVATPTRRKEKVNEPYTVKNQPRLDVLNLEDVLIDPTCNGNFDNARFCIYTFETSLSELKANGMIYSNLDVLEKSLKEDEHYDPERSTEHKDEFSYSHLSALRINGPNFKDKARRKLTAYEYWGYWDVNDDGTAVPIVATFVGDIMIRLEENPYPDRGLPFVVIPYHPVKDSIYGEPDAELLQDHQQQITAITRMIIDVSSKSAVGQVATPKGFVDANNKRRLATGMHYEYNPAGIHPKDAIYTHQGPELPQSLMQFFQHTYMEAESIVGINSHMGGMDQMAYMQNNGRGENNNALLTQIESSILARISYGLQRLAQKMVLMNSHFISENQTIPTSGSTFLKVTPDDLQGLPDDMNVQVSLTSMHDSMAKANELGFLLQTIGPSLDFSLVKAILSEIAMLTGLPEFASEVMNFEPQPDPVQQQLAQAEIQVKQTQAAKYQAEAEEASKMGILNEARAEYIQASTQKMEVDIDDSLSGRTQQTSASIAERQAMANSISDMAKDPKHPDNRKASSFILNQMGVNDTDKEVEAEGGPTDFSNDKPKKSIDHLLGPKMPVDEGGNPDTTPMDRFDYDK